MAGPFQAVLVVERRPWPELIASIAGQGYTVLSIDDIRLVPFFVLAGGVSAVVVDAVGLGMADLLALRQCRALAPSTAIVVIAAEATSPEIARALESGATAFLSWPSPPRVVAGVLRSGDLSP